MRKIKFELDGNLDVLNLEVKENTDVADVRKALKAECANQLGQFDAVELKLSLVTDGNVVELKPTALHSVIPDGSTVVIHHPPYKTEGPWESYVDISLPSAILGTNQVSTSKAKPPDRHYPLALKRWNSFTQNALSFQLPHEKPKFQDVVAQSTRLCSEPEVWTMLWTNVGQYFLGSSVGEIAMKGKTSSKRTADGDHKSSMICIGAPDLVAMNKSEHITGIIEAKVPWGVELVDPPGPNMTFIERYNCKLTDVEGKHTWSAVAQTVGYMLDNRLRYGLLTTYNENRFFFAHSVNEIEVSDVVLASSATDVVSGTVSLRRAFAYWLSLCNGSNTPLLVDRKFQKRLTGEWMKETHEADGSKKPDLASALSLDSTVTKAEDGSIFLNAPNISMTANARLSSLFSNSKYVDWSDLTLIEPLGGGRCGEVVLVLWQGRRIALKLFDVGKYGFDSFDRELQVHTLLLESHVKMAKLQLVTLSPSGQVYGIGSQFGRPMPALSTWSNVQRNSAFEALQSLVDVGVAQRDVCDRNFVSNASGDLLVIDLEDITHIESGEIDEYLASSRAYLFSSCVQNTK